MGIAIDHNRRYTPEQRAYLNARGRSYMVDLNARRFGTDEAPKDTPIPEQNPYYDPEERAKAVYDVGGAPLPGTVLDYDSGRVKDRENGRTVEYTGPGHQPGAYDLTPQRTQTDEGFDEYGEEGEIDIDDDIGKYIIGLPNKGDLKKAIIHYGGVDPGRVSDLEREDLENTLAVLMQEKRNAGEELEIPAA